MVQVDARAAGNQLTGAVDELFPASHARPFERPRRPQPHTFRSLGKWDHQWDHRRFEGEFRLFYVLVLVGRSAEIRTRDPLHPMQ